MYKERKETTHVEVGGENTHNHTHTHTHTYIYIYIKDKHNAYKHGHKIGVQEEEAKRSSP